MRWAVVLAGSALLVGCSGAPDGGSSATRTPLSVAAPRTTTSSGTATPTAAKPATTSNRPGAVGPGTAIGDVLDWVEAGDPATPGDFGTVTRAGVTTEVAGGIAFTTDTVNCISTTDYRDGALACLVQLDDPPPRPPDAFTVWKGNWVDFDGATVDIGSLRGDPGPFGAGVGRALAPGQSLAFGDFRCRADAADVLCVNYAQRSAARLGDSGIDGFGCLKKTTPPPGIGIRLSC